MTSRTPGHDSAELFTAAPEGSPDDRGERPTEPFQKIEETTPGPRPSARWSLPDIVDDNGDPEAGSLGDQGRPGHRVQGMPNASAWQRSHAVWHRAGVDWIHAAPTALPATAAPAPGAPPPSAPAPAPAPSAPPLPVRPVERSREIAWRPVAIGVAVVLAAGAGGYVLFGGDGDTHKRAARAGAVQADRMFAVDPTAKTDGLAQEFTEIAAVGGTAVAIGAEMSGPGRGRFLVSADGGRTWQLARVRAAHGAEPGLGEAPRLLAGGPGGWAALGGPIVAGAKGGTAVWTSADGREWTRQAPASDAAFAAQDRVLSLTRTPSGFVAVGVTGPGTATRGVLWSSADGRGWQRTDRPALGDAVILDRVAASAGNLVVHGTIKKSVTKAVKKKGKNSKVTSVVRENGFWRSADGGRTWNRVNVPQAQGSTGVAVGLVAGPGGFYVARNAQRTTGSKRQRKTVRYGVVSGSADGMAWAAVGQISVNGYAALERLSGSSAGLAVLVRVGGGKSAVVRSADGKTWQRAGDVAGPGVRGLAVLPATTIVAGRQGDDAYLSVPGTGDVNLANVPGAVHPERSIAALVPDGSRLVAVGSTNGDSAGWVAADGRNWTRANGLTAADGRQWLNDAAHGAQGWVAVGRDEAASLVLTSADGGGWQKAAALPGGGAAESVTAGPGGYVAVGRTGTAATAWHSADLKTWTRGSGTGDGTWMSDAAPVSAGYVAIGGRDKDKAIHPALWTSPDGKKWTSVTEPALPAGLTSGEFTRIAARAGTLVALGSGSAGIPAQVYAFLAVSADAGKTWQSLPLPGAPQGTTLTAVTATPKGFVAAGTLGEPGRRDVALWSSPDGRAWRSEPVHGIGLDGPGDQWLSALATVGNDLVAVGMTGDHRGESPILWRSPAP